MSFISHLSALLNEFVYKFVPKNPRSGGNPPLLQYIRCRRRDVDARTVDGRDTRTAHFQEEPTPANAQSTTRLCLTTSSTSAAAAGMWAPGP